MQPSTPANPGLTSTQVAERVARGESNNFKVQVGRSYWEIVRDNILNLFNIVLVILLIIMFAFRDYGNILFASFSVVLNSVLGMVQEINAKRALDKLAAMAIQEIKVWRDGKLVQVPMTGLVKDDVVPIEPGDRIAVDGRVLSADALEMDESLLTGESDAILKEQDGKLSSGSFCIAGSGVMVATEVGANSTINRLSQTAKAYRHPLTPTQRQINSLVEISLAGMLIFFPMTILSGLAQGISALEVVRNSVVLVTSFVPQGLVLVTTVSLTLGALRISRHKTLVQRINAVESMANVSVLCFDKTGTLTRNQLSVIDVLPLNGMSPDAIRGELKTYTANLAHQNKTAAAIAHYTGAAPQDGQHTHAKQSEIPFSSARKWGALVFPNQTLILGAPERVLDPNRSGEAVAHAQNLATQGLRVLAFARSVRPPEGNKLDDAREALALVVMSDQVRTEIQATLKAFAEQNVDLKVISGDNIETVRAIAQQAGMHISGAYTGDQLEEMAGVELEGAVQAGNIFARIEPETKRKIIRTLKGQGRYVAMVGDGVNDVPALKEANMAIAMNDGAQIAKDVADIVLLNNAMSTLPLAFSEGKTITQKIFGTSKLFLTKNFYTILAFIFVGYMTLPFPTNPIQISWLTFGAVNFPAILMTFGLLRPAYMRDFGTDVLNFVLTAVLVGSLVMATLYCALFLMTAAPYSAERVVLNLTVLDDMDPRLIDRVVKGGATDMARSATFVFMFLYGLIIFWNTHGVDVFKLKTFRKHWRVALLGVVFIALSILAPYALPQVFTFVPPRLEAFALVILAFACATVGVHWVSRNGAFLRMLRPSGAR